MNFTEQLNYYFNKIGFTSKELSEASRLSATVISRYRNGERVPSYGSKQLTELINGIAKLAEERNFSDITVDSVRESFSKILDTENNEFAIAMQNINKLIPALKINIADMSRNLGFDASYISRIRSGHRKPADPIEFIDSVCTYVSKRFDSEANKQEVAKLLNCSIQDLENPDMYKKQILNWIWENKEEEEKVIGNFLQKLDDFDLAQYIKLIHFDELKVPTVPFQLPSSKNYYGLEEMKQGELDFFKSTVLSKSRENVFMCSDMPMEDMAQDKEFGKKWMFAIAMSLKKGLHLNVIHNINRPFIEMMLGLESWIPIYMTGQVSPFYLKDFKDKIYGHSTYVSGNVALSGECINGYHGNGKYFITNKKDEVAYYKERANQLLKKSTPLMQIYTDTEKFKEFLDSEKSNEIVLEMDNINLKKTFKNIDFTICKNKWVALSKKTNPEIHFVIEHPLLRDAIENFIAPVRE